MSQFVIFVVEDNALYAKSTMHHLSLNPKNEVVVFDSGRELLNNLYRSPQVVFLDYSLPDGHGLELLRKLKERAPDIPVVVVSGQEDVATAVALLKAGAYDYIVKDKDARERMWNAVNHIAENAALRREVDALRQEVNNRYDFSNIIGSSAPIKAVFRLIEKAANTNINVTISGETGTGKELVAKAIHYNSRFKKSPLVSVNIAAIPKDLIESELFGHEKGAFTGAHQRRKGKFEEAHGGTLFLDEIGELDIHLQAKLLRAIQEKEITRVGGNQAIKAEARLMVATHRNLVDEVKKGHFREDLYYRLLGLPIILPPLRERGQDIILLAKFFLTQFCQENSLGAKSFSTEAKNKLLRYQWPGNIRELKACIELAAVMTDGHQLETQDISLPEDSELMGQMLDENLSLKEYNQQIIAYHLKKCDNRVLEVAKKLDIGKSTIYRMLKNKELSIN